MTKEEIRIGRKVWGRVLYICGDKTKTPDEQCETIGKVCIRLVREYHKENAVAQHGVAR